MMRTLIRIHLLIIVAMLASPSYAGSDGNSSANQSNDWNGVWQTLKGDCKEIGHAFKREGTDIGQAFKKEFREMPDNVRNAHKAAINDLKTVADPDHKKQRK